MGLCGTAQTAVGFHSNIHIEIVQADAHAVIKVIK